MRKIWLLLIFIMFCLLCKNISYAKGIEQNIGLSVAPTYSLEIISGKEVICWSNIPFQLNVSIEGENSHNVSFAIFVESTIQNIEINNDLETGSANMWLIKSNTATSDNGLRAFVNYNEENINVTYTISPN